MNDPDFPLPGMDEDALIAAIDVAGRSGATSIDVGYHEDEPEPDALNWYAQAFYNGARIMGEGRDPVEAAEALARKLLRGALCRRCGEPILLSGVHPPVARGCRWTRNGRKWEPGCGKPIDTSIPTMPGARG